MQDGERPAGIGAGGRERGPGGFAIRAGRGEADVGRPRRDPQPLEKAEIEVDHVGGGAGSSAGRAGSGADRGRPAGIPSARGSGPGRRPRPSRRSWSGAGRHRTGEPPGPGRGARAREAARTGRATNRPPNGPSARSSPAQGAPAAQISAPGNAAVADRLAASIPAARSKTEIADCGIDLDSFQPGDAGTARQSLGWEGEGPAFLCVGSLIERKNVVDLADAFAALGRGRLAFVGDGPQRAALERRPGVTIVGRVPQAEVPKWVAACDVLCQPSLIEPFGQATLEGMAMERTVVATTIGGPPEFVTSEAGVLVEPGDIEALTVALASAAAMPTPNPAAREAARAHDVKVEAAKMAAVLERAADARRPGSPARAEHHPRGDS